MKNELDIFMMITSFPMSCIVLVIFFISSHFIVPKSMFVQVREC